MSELEKLLTDTLYYLQMALQLWLIKDSLLPSSTHSINLPDCCLAHWESGRAHPTHHNLRSQVWRAASWNSDFSLTL